eukprot:TRINITY_DN53_c1_g1_i1.p1 TRINITY_DN53_c1_g1~~TRINITY_DN53_c1_g1_i1.p1  ORF type:complete len:268 (-),score=116.00 TRINITY_DN53_c1_g1_i1:130-933(-)
MATKAIIKNIKLIIFDIEGTTTSISFVADVLFPYARQKFPLFLEENWQNETVQNSVNELRQLSKEDFEKENYKNEPIPEQQNCTKEQLIQSTLNYLMFLMDQDRKVTPLKALQGRIWQKGYAQNQLLGHIYDDVLPTFQQLKQKSIPIYIYSSGSVQAQKLLFGFSKEGDLLHYFDGHFDTNIGLKLNSESYEAILKQLQLTLNINAQEILFVTDSELEAYAASKALFEIALSSRPGNKQLSEQAQNDFIMITSFNQLFNHYNFVSN